MDVLVVFWREAEKKRRRKAHANDSMERKNEVKETGDESCRVNGKNCTYDFLEHNYYGHDAKTDCTCCDCICHPHPLSLSLSSSRAHFSF